MFLKRRRITRRVVDHTNDIDLLKLSKHSDRCDDEAEKLYLVVCKVYYSHQ